jgi:hypothetical protein
MLVQNIQLELIRPPSGIIRCACGNSVFGSAMVERAFCFV